MDSFHIDIQLLDKGEKTEKCPERLGNGPGKKMESADGLRKGPDRSWNCPDGWGEIQKNGDKSRLARKMCLPLLILS